MTLAQTSGWVQPAQDEALIVDLTLGEAAYAVVPVTEVWGGIEDLTAQRSAIGTVQAQRRNDGGFTFAIARQDPSIVNWVDLGALARLLSCCAGSGLIRSPSRTLQR